MQNDQNPLAYLTPQNLEIMYPDICNRIKPYIDDISMQLRNQNVSEEMIESIIQDISTRCGFTTTPHSNACPLNSACPADNNNDFNTEAVAVQRNMNFGNRNFRNPRYPNYPQRRRYPRYPTFPIYPTYPVFPVYPSSPEDIIRIMLLRQLFGY